MHLTSTTRHPWRFTIVALAMAILTACGGGGSSSSSSTSSGSSEVTAFPTGVALSSPTALDSSSNVVSASQIAVPWDVRLADWGRAMWQAARTQDSRTAGVLLLKLLPLPEAWAATTKVPEGAVVASEIEAVSKGTLSLTHPGLLNITDLFNANGTNATCFGPSVAYTAHDDYVSGPGQNGTLPSGDLGMWTDDNTDADGTQPCAAAQLKARVGGTKKQVRQAMILMAAMRRLIASSSTLDMPAVGASTDVQSALSTALASAAPGVIVDAATVSFNNLGTLYNYRLVLSAGSGVSAKRGEVVIQHTPGASATQFAGVLQITASQLSTDSAFGCSDEIDGGTSRYKVAVATTIRYDRNGTALDLGARSAAYCGAPGLSSSSHLDDIAALDSDGMLDFTVDLGGSSTRGGVKGWRGSASRIGAVTNTSTQAGEFLYIWQAGNNDDRARAFAAHSEYNSSTEARTIQAYYAYTAAIDTTDGDLLGMICNWAGPGNSHTPQDLFQSQTATLAATDTIWTRTSSMIGYAPTVSCNSGSGMRYDADGSGGIGTLEGQSVTHGLDDLSSGITSVANELMDRGFTKPTLF